MITFLEGFVVFVMVFIIAAYVYNQYGEVEYFTSSLDGNSYLVRKLSDRSKAADILAQVNIDTLKLIKHLRAKYPDGPEGQRLLDNYHPLNLSEGGHDSGFTSFTVDKGRKIVLCLRQKDDLHSFVLYNTIMFVHLHEVSHVCTISIDHTPEFWDMFRFIIREAIEIGIYSRVDYSVEPAPYCGIHIKSTVA